VSQKPQRPFVPHRTPPERRVTDRATEFRIAPPFVHGAGGRGSAESAQRIERESLAPIAAFQFSESPAAAAESAPSISDFLRSESPAPISDFMANDSPASISDFLAPESSFETSSGGDGSEYELPPIEHFTDPIPDEGALAADDNLESAPDPFGYSGADAESNSFGWEETDWQRYDWRSAAALGETTDPEASSAWAQTDWGLGGAPPPPTDIRESAAKAIADALDGIARRIRDGDLVIPSAPAAVPDPATIAATLAALLGVKR